MQEQDVKNLNKEKAHVCHSRVHCDVRVGKETPSVRGAGSHVSTAR